MNTAAFNEIVARRVALIQEVLVAKAKEYSTEDDRLHNFTVAARVGCTTKKKALWGMAMKHLVCILDIVEAGATRKEYSDEKIGDLINYLILLEAVLEEERTVG